MSLLFHRPGTMRGLGRGAHPETARRLRRGAAAVLMAATCVIAIATPALAKPIQPGYHWLYGFHSGKCISVKNASSANGVQLHQDPCTNTRSYGWLGVNGFHGEEYFFRNDTSSKCMSIRNHNNGSAIVQEPCNYRNPPANERFVQIYMGQSHNYGWYLIQSVASGLCLRVNVASKKNGAALVQHHCNQPNGQEFFLFVKAGTHMPCPCNLPSTAGPAVAAAPRGVARVADRAAISR